MPIEGRRSFYEATAATANGPHAHGVANGKRGRRELLLQHPAQLLGHRLTNGVAKVFARPKQHGGTHLQGQLLRFGPVAHAGVEQQNQLVQMHIDADMLIDTEMKGSAQ